MLTVTNGSLYATTGVAALALAEVNLLAGVLGFTIAADSAGKLAAAGEIVSDNGTFQSVSSTDIYCTNIEVYNNATVDRDLWVVGNMYLNTGTLFGSKIDVDNATITTSLTVPQMNMTYATIGNIVTAVSVLF